MNELQEQLSAYINTNGYRQAYISLGMNGEAIEKLLSSGTCPAVDKVNGIAKYLDMSPCDACTGSKLVPAIKKLLGDEIPRYLIANDMGVCTATLNKMMNTGKCKAIDKTLKIGKALGLSVDCICGHKGELDE